MSSELSVLGMEKLFVPNSELKTQNSELLQRERGQVILRHTELTAYRCFLPDLAGFTGFYCTGPSPFFKFKVLSTRKDNRSCSLSLSTQYSSLSTVRMAERVGFEPTVPLLGRMLSKHVDSTTLAPLRTKFSRGGILTWGPVTSKLTVGVHDQLWNRISIERFCTGWIEIAPHSFRRPLSSSTRTDQPLHHHSTLAVRNLKW